MKKDEAVAADASYAGPRYSAFWRQGSFAMPSCNQERPVDSVSDGRRVVVYDWRNHVADL